MKANLTVGTSVVTVEAASVSVREVGAGEQAHRVALAAGGESGAAPPSTLPTTTRPRIAGLVAQLQERRRVRSPPACRLSGITVSLEPWRLAVSVYEPGRQPGERELDRAARRR